MVYRSALFADEYLESNRRLNSSQERSLEIFTVRAAAIRASEYRHCKLDNDLLRNKEASFFFRIVSLTSWFHQNVLFSLPAATLSRFRLQLSTANEITAVWKKHFISMSSEHFGSCQNFAAKLNANCFLTSLSAMASVWSVSHIGPTQFLFSQGFEIRREKATRWWSVNNSASLFTRTSNTSKNKSDETLQNSTKVFCAILDLYHVYLLWTSLCWKRVFIMQSPLLQQKCNRYLPFSINNGYSRLPITPFHVLLYVLMCSLKSLKRIVDYVVPTLWRASLALSTKIWSSLTALGAYTCNRHNDRSFILSFSIQIRDPKGIQSNTQSDNWQLMRIEWKRSDLQRRHRPFFLFQNSSHCFGSAKPLDPRLISYAEIQCAEQWAMDWEWAWHGRG